MGFLKNVFHDAGRLYEGKLFFEILEGEKNSAKFPRNWNRKFVGGIAIHSKVRKWKKWIKSETKTFESSEKKNHQRKAFKANLNELKRKPPKKEIKNEPMLPYDVFKFNINFFINTVSYYTQTIVLMRICE